MYTQRQLPKPPIAPGFHASYHLHYTAHAHSVINFLEVPQAFKVEIDLYLEIAHLPFAQGLILAVRRHKLNTEGLEILLPNLRSALDMLTKKPTVVLYRPPFELQTTLFAPEISPVGIEILRQIVCWFQTGFSSLSRWTQIEKWTDREVLAEYKHVRNLAQRQRFRKTWQTYPSKRSDVMPPLSTVEADFNLDIDIKTKALVGLQGTMRQTDNQKMGSTEYSIELSLMSKPSTILPPQIKRYKRLLNNALRTYQRHIITKLMTYEEFLKKTYEGYLQNFDLKASMSFLLEANKKPELLDNHPLFSQLGAYFGLHSQKISEFIEWLLSIEPSDRLIVFVIASLLNASEYPPALSATQRAVIYLVERFEHRSQVVIQFLAHLPFLKRVSSELLEFMWRKLWSIPETVVEVVQANWVLASGGLVRLAPQRATAKQILRWLERRLQSATDLRQQGLYLSALGNSGQTEVMPFIKQFLNHPDDWLRSQAVSALRFMETDEAQTLLWRAATSDSSPIVRKEALSALKFQKMHIPIVYLVEAFCKESEPAIQELIWEHIQQHPRSEWEAPNVFLRLLDCVRNSALRRRLLEQKDGQ